MMGQVKKEMMSAEVWWPVAYLSDKPVVTKMKKEELIARLRLMEGHLKMYEILEKTFGYCHPDVQVARMGKAEALRVHEKMERERMEMGIEKIREKSPKSPKPLT